MRDFVRRSVPGLLAIAAVAGLGYYVLTPPKAAQAAVAELGFHDADCAVCRLPLVARGTEASRYGHTFPSHNDAAAPTR
jgi:hypothetical protein